MPWLRGKEKRTVVNLMEERSQKGGDVGNHPGQEEENTAAAHAFLPLWGGWL